MKQTETKIGYDIFNSDGTISTKVTDAKGNISYDTLNVAGMK